MSHCPVCEKDYTGDFCIYCGFIESEDIVKYRTVAAIHDLDNPKKRVLAGALPIDKSVDEHKNKSLSRSAKSGIYFFWIIFSTAVLSAFALKFGDTFFYRHVTIAIIFSGIAIIDLVVKLILLKNPKKSLLSFCFTVFYFSAYSFFICQCIERFGDYYGLPGISAFASFILLYALSSFLIFISANAENKAKTSSVCWVILSAVLIAVDFLYQCVLINDESFFHYELICNLVILSFILALVAVSIFVILALILKILSADKNFSIFNFIAPSFVFVVYAALSVYCVLLDEIRIIHINKSGVVLIPLFAVTTVLYLIISLKKIKLKESKK